MWSIPKELRAPIAAAVTLATLGCEHEKSSLQDKTSSNLSTTSTSELIRADEVVLTTADSISAQLRRHIGALKGKGFRAQDFEISGDLGTEDRTVAILAILGLKEAGFVVREQNPADQLLLNNAAYVVGPASLVGRAPGKIKLPFLSLSISPGRVPEGEVEDPRFPKHLRVQIFDRLSESDPVLIDTQVDSRNKVEVAALGLKVLAFVELRREELNREIEAIAPIESKGIYGLLTLGPSERVQSNSKVQFVRINAMPQQGAQDVDTLSVALRSEGAADERIELHGQLHSICLDVTLPPGSFKRSSIGFLEWDDGRSLRSSWTDRYGNLIDLDLRKMREGPEGVTVGLVVTPPAVCQAGPATLVDLDIDLNPLRMGEIKGKLARLSIPLVNRGSNHEPAVYSTLDSEQVIREFSPLLTKIRAGVRTAQEMYGLPSEEGVQNVIIMPARYGNAFYQRQNTRSLMLYDQILRRSPEAADEIAQHETFHFLDAHFGDLLSRGEFSSQWYLIRKESPPQLPAPLAAFYGQDFFSALDERNFLGSTGGHSAYAPEEMFASFCNSLTAPNWSEQLKRKGYDFQEKYYLSLVALQQNLECAPGLPKDAPIRSILKDRRMELEVLLPSLGNGLGLSQFNMPPIAKVK